MTPSGVPRFEEEDLDEALLGVAAIEPRGPDPDVVADQEIARAQKLRQVGEPPVPELSGLAIQDEQAALPPRPGLLRDAVGRQLVVEEGDAHV
jgi:hypothetical protein